MGEHRAGMRCVKFRVDDDTEFKELRYRPRVDVPKRLMLKNVVLHYCLAVEQGVIVALRSSQVSQW